LGAPIRGDLLGSFMFSSEIVTAGPCGFVLQTIPIESFQIVNLRWTPLSRQKMVFLKVEKYTLVLGEFCPVLHQGYVYGCRAGTGSCTREPGGVAPGCRNQSRL
jgi:hypothetical protein